MISTGLKAKAQARTVECEALRACFARGTTYSTGDRFEIDEESAIRLQGAGRVNILGSSAFVKIEPKPTPTPAEKLEAGFGPPTTVRALVNGLIGNRVCSRGAEFVSPSEKEAIDLTQMINGGVVRVAITSPLTQRGEQYRNKLLNIDTSKGVADMGLPCY